MVSPRGGRRPPQEVCIKPTTLGRLYGHFDQAMARERIRQGSRRRLHRRRSSGAGPPNLSHELCHKGPICRDYALSPRLIRGWMLGGVGGVLRGQDLALERVSRGDEAS